MLAVLPGALLEPALLRLADEPPREALRPPPELLEAVLEAAGLEKALREDEPFLLAVLLEVAFLAAPFFEALFLAAPLRDEDLLAPPLEDFEALFLTAVFLAAPFLAAPFLAAPFLEALFEEPPLPEDEPPLEDEPPRLDLAAPFFEALLEEDLPPELLPDDFLDAAFLVDFAIVNGFLVRDNKFSF